MDEGFNDERIIPFPVLYSQVFCESCGRRRKFIPESQSQSVEEVKYKVNVTEARGRRSDCTRNPILGPHKDGLPDSTAYEDLGFTGGLPCTLCRPSPVCTS